MNRTFTIFLLCNGFAAGVNFGSRMVFSLIMSYAAAVVCAYLCGMITAFLLSRAVVFQAAGGSFRTQAVRFAIINAAAILQTLIVSVVLNEHVLPWWGWTWHREEVAHAVGVCVPVFSSYFGHKYWSFRKA